MTHLRSFKSKIIKKYFAYRPKLAAVNHLKFGKEHLELAEIIGILITIQMP
jgi:hypothetical protein